MFNRFRQFPFWFQYVTAAIFIIAVSLVSYMMLPLIGYKSVALLLLFVVSTIAVLFHLKVVLFASFLSVLIWDYFFIPPVFTFSVGSTDDKLMVIMYFVVALLNAFFTNRLKQIDKAEQEKNEKEKSLQLYNTLFNSLSHELRTPIAGIIASVDNIKGQKLSAEQQEELLDQTIISAYRLNRQVENLLHMSRLESGTLSIKKDWCDINDIIYQSVDLLKDLGQQHTTTINIADDFPMCKIDGGLMLQVINNLLQNAYTYVPVGGNVTVSAKNQAAYINIIVEDDGYGLLEEDTNKIFEKFYRPKNSKVGGTGLGLSIVKGYVEAHAGKIQLNNKKSGGAQFTIEIPCDIQRRNEISFD